MNKIKVATLLCVCYAALLLQPVLPVFNDVMAHMFYESEHIATVHYENGSYHVHVEIREASEQNANEHPQANNIEQISSVHMAGADPVFIVFYQECVRLVEHTRCCNLHNGYFSVPAPPPWLV